MEDRESANTVTLRREPSIVASIVWTARAPWRFDCSMLFPMLLRSQCEAI